GVFNRVAAASARDDQSQLLVLAPAADWSLPIRYPACTHAFIAVVPCHYCHAMPEVERCGLLGASSSKGLQRVASRRACRVWLWLRNLDLQRARRFPEDKPGTPLQRAWAASTASPRLREPSFTRPIFALPICPAGRRIPRMPCSFERRTRRTFT